MDIKEHMIVDLDKRGTKDMFVTERIAVIKENSKRLWSVLFNGSQRWFHYNPSRLLYLTDPESIDLGEKGLYINNSLVFVRIAYPPRKPLMWMSARISL